MRFILLLACPSLVIYKVCLRPAQQIQVLLSFQLLCFKLLRQLSNLIALPMLLRFCRSLEAYRLTLLSSILHYIYPFS